ncbi:hypothetical protein [Nocardia sp. BMG51109]|uniref:hypothetical protein n=1 Tax=Nocardia sp. BMG51109 TaxID=1056816 RepID=UPI000467A086|nr:hypothetical protein [Nocardia sp. BMG51109]
MNDRLKFAAFGGGLVVLFGAALGIGALVGEPAAPAAEHGHASSARPDEDTASGLQSSRSGYTLTDISAPAEPNRPGVLRFRITGPDGRPVTAFEPLHDKQLHLIAVRSDTTGYRHVHPELGPDGTWSIAWNWAEPGTYRIFADFSPGTTAGDGPGELVLSRTVEVAGDAPPHPLPAVSRTADVDGYRIALDGDLSTAGSELRFTVTRDGRPVTDLEPYLGAYAHLVALRTPDLEYLHVHPEGDIGTTPPGPRVAFHAQAPGAGTYRLYLDFAHGRAVHTAEFTVESSTAPAVSSGHEGHGGDHR